MLLCVVPGSPNCRKVQAVVNGLSAPVEIVLVDFASGAHKRPDYLVVSPNGLVPSLVDGDLRLWESTAIMQYLADLHGETTLFPKDPRWYPSPVKLRSERVAAAIAGGGGEPFAPSGRVFREWLAVGVGDAARWEDLVGEAYAFVTRSA